MPFDLTHEPERLPCPECGDTGLRTIPINPESIGLKIPAGSVVTQCHGTVCCFCLAGDRMSKAIHLNRNPHP